MIFDPELLILPRGGRKNRLRLRIETNKGEIDSFAGDADLRPGLFLHRLVRYFVDECVRFGGIFPPFIREIAIDHRGLDERMSREPPSTRYAVLRVAEAGQGNNHQGGQASHLGLLRRGGAAWFLNMPGGKGGNREKTSHSFSVLGR